MSVSNDNNDENRGLIESFLRESDGWDFEGFSGKKPEEVVTTWHKVAGLYGGNGIAADAFRYGVLRDYGYPEEEVAIAREHLKADLERLHMASAITGVDGVIARGYIRTDIPSYGADLELTALFDEEGNPLPEEKTNGTWRADNSGGLYPNWVWEDSCSRDQYIGWIAAYGASWEVIKDDDTFLDELKEEFQSDALKLGQALMEVQESGYDLELPDADGRTTLHGYMNENNLDRVYFPGIQNGFYAIMALGVVGTLVYVTQDEALKSYLYDELINERDLPGICKESMMLVDGGLLTNYSNVNMAFQGAWLAVRYITESPAVSAKLRSVLAFELYDNGGERPPRETAESFYDFIYAGGMAGATAMSGMTEAPDAQAMAQGLQTLRWFPEPPYWQWARENCDEAEIEAFECVALDDSTITLLGYEGRNGQLIADAPVPMNIRPHSNYHWRSHPYGVNGDGDGSGMNPGVDFRWAYWLGRWTK